MDSYENFMEIVEDYKNGKLQENYPILVEAIDYIRCSKEEEKILSQENDVPYLVLVVQPDGTIIQYTREEHLKWRDSPEYIEYVKEITGGTVISAHFYKEK